VPDATPPVTPPPKKDVARALLLRGNLFVWLDPRRDDVRVPVQFAGQPELVLQIGLDMPIPIPDLRVDDQGVHGTLSFQRSPFACFVPWDAVFALADDHGHGRVWLESVPPEIAAEIETSGGEAIRRKSDKGRDREKEPRRARPRAVLAAAPALAPAANPPEPVAMRAIEGGATAGPRRDAAPRRGPRELPPYLRVVK
jgi:stringent starvation protein B